MLFNHVGWIEGTVPCVHASENKLQYVIGSGRFQQKNRQSIYLQSYGNMYRAEYNIPSAETW